MTPYYTDEYCTIYHGDCRDVLPTLEPVDLVLTDPPYGLGIDGQRPCVSGGISVRKCYEFLGWDTERPSADAFAAILTAAGANLLVAPGGKHRLPSVFQLLTSDVFRRLGVPLDQAVDQLTMGFQR